MLLFIYRFMVNVSKSHTSLIQLVESEFAQLCCPSQQPHTYFFSPTSMACARHCGSEATILKSQNMGLPSLPCTEGVSTTTGVGLILTTELRKQQKELFLATALHD